MIGYEFRKASKNGDVIPEQCDKRLYTSSNDPKCTFKHTFDIITDIFDTAIQSVL